MADYIELETAIDFVKNNTPTIDGMTTLGCVERSLYNAPNANVVEVVRCKDCKHYEARANSCFSPHWDMESATEVPYVCEIDFCSYGERKDGE